MGLDDWIISLALMLVVLRQIRGRRLTVTGIVWPVALVAWAAFTYLRQIPSYSSDWLFTIALAVVGLALGLATGLLTKVYRDQDKVIGKATGAAAALWIIGMGSRVAFGIVALHGGAKAIGTLSEHLHLHSASTWPTALITMALCEVLSRTLLLLVRYRQASRQAGGPGRGAITGQAARPDPQRLR
jgi:hypothetical protein